MYSSEEKNFRYAKARNISQDQKTVKVKRHTKHTDYNRLKKWMTGIEEDFGN